MLWQWSPYVIPLALSATISLALAVYGAMRLRRGRSALVAGFVVTMVGATLWAGLYAPRIGVTTLDGKLLFTNLDVGKNVAVLGFVVFVLALTNKDRFLKPRWIALLAAWPALFYLVIRPTWQFHDLWIRRVAVVPLEGARRISITYGVANDFDAIWAYVLMAVGMAVLLDFGYRNRGVYRRQAALVFLGALAPTAVNVPMMGNAWEFVPLEWPYAFNPSPVAVSVTGVLLAVAIFRYRFLDLAPVGRDRVVETMRDGYVVIDERDRVVDLNPAARELLDVDGDPIGDSIGELLPDTGFVDRSRAGDGIQGSFEVGEGEGTRYVEVDVSPLSRGDQSIGRLVSLRDVTDRRSVEHRYQTLIENASDLITVVGRDGTIQYQSPSIRRILGYRPDEMVGESVFSYVHPDDAADLRDGFEAFLDEDADIDRAEVRVETAHGDYRTVEAVGRDLLDDPFVEGVVLNSRDVTRRKERERKLERKNERLDQFASVVTHDLRNPLSVAKGRTELAIERDPDAHLPQVRRSLDRIESIVEGVLRLARHGEEVGDTVRIDMATQAQRAWRNVDTGGAELVVVDSRNLLADPDRSLQLFENLFRNAVEHGGETVTVTVGTTRDGFYVDDDGPGIPEEERGDVFDSGFTTDEDGTGFGLAIVERIAEAHGWSVRAADSEDGGARFEVTGVEQSLPAEPADD